MKVPTPRDYNGVTIFAQKTLKARRVRSASAGRYAPGRLMKTSRVVRQLISRATAGEVSGRVIMPCDVRHASRLQEHGETVN